MADEIIVGERSNGSQAFWFYYPIPLAQRLTVGDTGNNVVPTPAPTEGVLFDVLTAAERTALDAGEAYLHPKSVTLTDGITDPQLLAEARTQYAKWQPKILAVYQKRYKHIGDRFDK